MIPMPIPTPIFLPSGSPSGMEMIYPEWVVAIACFGVLVGAIGSLWMIAALILSIITNDRIDITKKPHSYSFAVAMFGLGILIVAVMLMLVTGQQIAE